MKKLCKCNFNKTKSRKANKTNKNFKKNSLFLDCPLFHEGCEGSSLRLSYHTSRSSIVGCLLNNNSKYSRNDQKWSQVQLIVLKHSRWKKLFFWNCQNFDVTVRPLNIDKFLRNLTKSFFAKPPTWAKVEVATIKFSNLWAAATPYSTGKWSVISLVNIADRWYWRCHLQLRGL